jgi:hypothetical protein
MTNQTIASTCAADDENEPETKWPETPLGRLAQLSACGDISPAERDAGEIFHRIGTIAISNEPHTATVTHPWRYANGIWSTLFERKQNVIERYEAALEAAGNNERRRALVASLVARECKFDIDWIPLIQSGLQQVARSWWDKPATATVSRNGITLPVVRFIDNAPTADNDNAPTAERIRQAGDVVQAEDAVRVRDNFERIYTRGQLDPDGEVATALFAAGLRYQSEFELSRLAGEIGSPDYSKPIVDGGGETRTPIGVRAQAARTALRAVRDAMGAQCASVVDAVVLRGERLEDVGLATTGYRSGKMAGAVAKERLNQGLRALAIHYGIAVRRRAA